MNIKLLDADVKVKGKVIVTDPCYLFPHAEWEEICDHIESFGNGAGVEVDGKTMYIMTTAYGDGTYPVLDHITEEQLGTFGVDSGTFAVVPLELADTLVKARKDTTLLQLVEGGNATVLYFPDEIVVEEAGVGGVRLGQYDIDTEGHSSSDATEHYEEIEPLNEEDAPVYINGRRVIIEEDGIDPATPFDSED